MCKSISIDLTLIKTKIFSVENSLGKSIIEIHILILEPFKCHLSILRLNISRALNWFDKKQIINNFIVWLLWRALNAKCLSHKLFYYKENLNTENLRRWLCDDGRNYNMFERLKIRINRLFKFYWSNLT